MKTEILTLPAHWASALVNGDLTGYEGDDLEAIRRFTERMVTNHGQCWCVDVAEDTGFVTYHDAREFLPLAADCADFTFDVTART